MNSAVAAGAGLGAVAVGLFLLAWQIGQWWAGDPNPPVHFVAGLVMAALLFLGGGILGTMGGSAAALGDGIGEFALAGATGAHTGTPPRATGGEKVGVGGAVLGLCLLGFYAAAIKSGRGDIKGSVIRGALCGVFLGAGAGLVGMWLGMIRTSGNTVGEMLINTF